MSRSLAVPGKRKRPGAAAPALSSDEKQILDLILSKGSFGISAYEIQFETKISKTAVSGVIASLKSKVLIKEVKGVQHGGRKICMGVGFTPSDQVSGGIWYLEGKLDSELVDKLKELCRLHLKRSKVATLEGIHKFVQQAGVVTVEVPQPQLAGLLNSMVLGNDIVEVKSTGLGNCSRIPVGETCYRLSSAAAAGGDAKTLITGAFALIPCGMCPRIALCTPDGVISPTTCVYFNKWLDIDKKPMTSISELEAYCA